MQNPSFYRLSQIYFQNKLCFSVADKLDDLSIEMHARFKVD